jgi:DNA (cytosine-5)-methyltransferase 1
MKKYTIVETFVGCGGSHLGFKNKNFESLLVNDINKNMLDTLLYNDKDITDQNIFIGSIKDLTKDIIQQKINKPVDVLLGGIVCKGFSLAGVRNPFDERNYLYLEQLRLVEILKPKVNIIENVIGLKNMILYQKNQYTEETFKKYTELVEQNKKYNGEKSSRRKNNLNYNDLNQLIKNNNDIMKTLLENIDSYKYNIFDDIQKKYETLGYKVYSKVLNSYDYGSFTSRNRLIIIAIHQSISKEYNFPKPISNNKTLGDCLKLINYDIEDNDNIPMNHSEKTIQRFSYIPEGKTIQDVIDHLPNHLKISAFYSRGNTMRLDRNKQVPTLVPGHSNFPIHPFKNRQLTIREAATITGFPQNYKFFGSHTSRCEQIGNAIPICLAEAIADSVIEVLS